MLTPDLLLSDNWQLCAVKHNEIDVEQWLQQQIDNGKAYIPENMTFEQIVEATIEDEDNIHYYMVPDNIDHSDEDLFIELLETYNHERETYWLNTPETKHFHSDNVFWVVYNEQDGWTELPWEDKDLIAIPAQD